MPESKELTCATCGEPFLFTVGEEQFLREKFGDDFAPPRHCKPCRQRRKESQGQRQPRRRF